MSEVGRSDAAPWLPNLPNHWERKRLKLLFRLMGGGTPSKDHPEYWIGDMPWVSSKDMKVDLITDTEDHISEEAVRASATNVVPLGTIMIVARSGILKHTIPVAITGRRVAINQDIKAFLPRRGGLEARYFAYLIRGFQAQLLTLWRSQGATVESLDTEIIGNTDLPLPPVEEQRAIADFLDRETAKIDALIAKQTELADRIDEKFRSVLDHAIRFGISAGPALRPSGSSWIGQIPSHWQVKPLMRLTSDDRQIMYGIVLPGPDIPDGIPIVKGGDVAPGKLRLERLKRTTKEIEAGYARSRLRGGDLVYAIRGSIGAVEKVPEELTGANLTQDAARVSPRDDVNPDWLLYALRSTPVFRQLEAGAVGATIRGINIRDLKHAVIPVPPRHEQDEIAGRLQHADESAQRAAALARASMETLFEHRDALIAAAISGQIELGGAANPEQQFTVASNDNRRAFRAAVGAEIVSRHGASKTLGRVKLQKLLYLAEVHAGVHELAGVYAREAAGPLARDLLSDAERGMETAGYFSTVAPVNTGEGYTYARIGKPGSHGNQLASLLGQREVALKSLIDRLKDYDTRQVEAITTLYAVWNDALLDGETPDDDRIVRGVLKEWHPEKADKFTIADLKTWLAWMRRNGLVPKGTGSRTHIDRLFV